MIASSLGIKSFMVSHHPRDRWFNIAPAGSSGAGVAPPELLPVNKRGRLPHPVSTSHWMLAASGREQKLEEALSFGLVPNGQRTEQLHPSGPFGSRGGFLKKWVTSSLIDLRVGVYCPCIPRVNSWQQRTVFPPR